jgi:hypothetical protein
MPLATSVFNAIGVSLLTLALIGIVVWLKRS